MSFSINKTQIHSNQFIVVSMSKVGGNFSMSQRPHVHTTYAEALHEAQRLAGQFTDKKFIVVAVAAIAESRPVENPVVTSYRL